MKLLPHLAEWRSLLGMMLLLRLLHEWTAGKIVALSRAAGHHGRLKVANTVASILKVHGGLLLLLLLLLTVESLIGAKCAGLTLEGGLPELLWLLLKVSVAGHVASGLRKRYRKVGLLRVERVARSKAWRG